jgi:hypothetical protein
MRLLPVATLLTIAVVLAGTAVYELSAPLDPVSVDPAPAARRALRPVVRLAFVPPPESSFADIDARPLFSAGRKPLEDTALAGGSASAASDLTLVGVIVDGEHSIALFRSKSTAQSSSAALGAIVNGWRVARIDPTSVTLRSGSGDVVLSLEGPSDRPPSAPLPSLSSTQTTQSDWSVAPSTSGAGAASPPAPTPVLTSPSMAVGSPPRPPPAVAPAMPARSASAGTIAPEALKGAPRDPKTGEPTL